MKVIVLKVYRDKYTKNLHKAEEEIEITKERYKELTTSPLGVFVKEIEEEPPLSPPEDKVPPTQPPEDKEPEGPPKETEQLVENELPVDPPKDYVIIGVDLSNGKDMSVINGEVVENPDFEKMAKSEIIEYAKRLNIELNMKMTKAEMIEILSR